MKWLISILIIGLLTIPIVFGETRVLSEEEYKQKVFNMQNQSIIENNISSSNSGIIELNWYQKLNERLKSWYYQIKQKFQ